jgi:DNA-binding CsgD family transcriptional regulator
VLPPRNPGDDDYELSLSPRERQTLRFLASGCTYVQAANRMGISAYTVDTYVRRIRAKSGAESFADLVRMAIELDIY